MTDRSNRALDIDGNSKSEVVCRRGREGEVVDDAADEARARRLEHQVEGRRRPAAAATPAAGHQGEPGRQQDRSRLKTTGSVDP